MKKLMYSIASLLVAVTALTFTSCANEDNPAEPAPAPGSRVAGEIPAEVLERLQNYMPLYAGLTPPNVENTYIIAPDELVYDSSEQFEIGHHFMNAYLRFSNQDMTNATVDFEKLETEVASGNAQFIDGTGNNFTIYVIATQKNEERGWIFKAATILSGTKTDAGIKDLYWGFVTLESNWPGKVEAGVYRIMKDGDGLTEYATWPLEENAARTRAERVYESNDVR